MGFTSEWFQYNNYQPGYAVVHVVFESQAYACSHVTGDVYFFRTDRVDAR